MKLDRVRIRNFRSIKDVTLKFEPRCQILVGINESGKTNILRALQLIKENEKSTDADIRNPLTDEPYDEHASVTFAFKLEKEEISQVVTAISSKTLVKDINTTLCTYNKMAFDITKMAQRYTEGLRWEQLKTHKKNDNAWSMAAGVSIAPGWVSIKPSQNLPAYKVRSHDNIEKMSSDFEIAYLPDYPELAKLNFQALTSQELDWKIGGIIGKLVTPQVPPCTVWRYDESHLLPSRVQIAPFLENPSSCLPLEQMFALADIQDIKSTFNLAKSRGSSHVRNLLERVANAATKHISGIWKECKGLQIKLEPNADHIEASILDSVNRYDFSSRSDGFKRFVSFLLIISASARKKKLTNTILLIDEPEIGLHPSGVKYLRDELLKISENNHVIISTHSIFMIDRENISRHLRVVKNGEITTVLPVNESNFRDEEVVYNALGYTIFEGLDKKNLVFEGWGDKHLFEIALPKIPAAMKTIKKKFQNVGLCHLQGVKDAARVSPMLDLANRDYIIISDNDQAAKEAQTRFNGEGSWLRYGEVINLEKIVTSEDFIKPKGFEKAIQKIRGQYPALPPIDLTEAKQGRIKALKNWLKTAGIEGDNQKDLMEEIKTSTIQGLTAKDIEPEYFDFLKGLAEKL